MMYNSRLKMILKYKQSQHRGREGRIELNDRYNRYSFPKMENLQSFHQELFTFPREVLSCIINPDLISNQTVNSDARKRAKSILDVIISAGSYTTSLGIPFIRQTVSNFIAQTDNVAPPKIDNIFLTEGATQGVHLIIKTLISNGDNAVMVPIPNYPLYPASISLNGGEMVPYQLKQDSFWQIQSNELERAYEESKRKGKLIKAIIVINPGNPTGVALSVESIQKILEFAVKKRLLVIADEVYRESLYRENSKFNSCLRVLSTLKAQFRDNCQLVSLNSVSKSLAMQGGFRGGYLYLHNLHAQVMHQLTKFQTTYGCSNVVGQLLVELMLNPFHMASDTTKIGFERQYNQFWSSLRQRRNIITTSLQQMENIGCSSQQGGPFVYPSVKLSKAAEEAAAKVGLKVDQFYCNEMFDYTGTALIPGSYFSQSPATHNFRMCPMFLPVNQLQNMLSALKIGNANFHKNYKQ